MIKYEGVYALCFFLHGLTIKLTTNVRIRLIKGHDSSDSECMDTDSSIDTDVLLFKNDLSHVKFNSVPYAYGQPIYIYRYTHTGLAHKMGQNMCMG